MYNRYIPQPDGSFRRSRVPESHPQPDREADDQLPPEEDCAEPQPEPCAPERKSEESPKQPPKRPSGQRPCRPSPPKQFKQARRPPSQEHRTQERPQEKKEEPIGSFLRSLLPQGLDTGDLMIVLLLLLIAGDCEEQRSNAILTLALYFLL